MNFKIWPGGGSGTGFWAHSNYDKLLGGEVVGAFITVTKTVIFRLKQSFLIAIALFYL